jgi:hypothetical protein
LNLLQEKIRQLQNDIFAYKIETVPVQLSELMNGVIEQGLLDLNDAGQVQRFNRIMQAGLEAVQNRDYLLLADIMEYEFKAMLPNEEFMA